MIKYDDVQDFYDHENSLDYDETLDVGVEDPTSSIKFKTASSFVIILILLGGVEILHIIDYFLPWRYVSYLSLFFLIPSVLAYRYVLTSLEDYWMKRWDLRKKETLLLHATIRKAIWNRDFTPLFPACNPSWLKYATENSYMWIASARAAEQQRKKRAEPLTPLDVDTIYARAFGGKVDPYSGRPIACKADYDAFLQAYRADEKSLYETLPDKDCD